MHSLYRPLYAAWLCTQYIHIFGVKDTFEGVFGINIATVIRGGTLMSIKIVSVYPTYPLGARGGSNIYETQTNKISISPPW